MKTNENNLHKYIDHTVLKADASKSEVEKICSEAMKYNFASVCINPTWVSLAKKILSESDVKVCTVIGFPLGANSSNVKGFETQKAIADGADEVDMVINIAALKDNEEDYVINDINAVVNTANGKTVKVIIETCLLTPQEKIKACELIMKTNADFVKTSTGFSSGGATIEDIELMKSVVKDKLLIKASGGIKNKVDALRMIEAGADRLGTSGGVQIVEDKENNKGY